MMRPFGSWRRERCAATTVLPLCSVLLVLLLSSDVAQGGYLNAVDTYYTKIEITAGSTYFNATQNYPPSLLTSFSTDVCASVLPYLPAASANITKSCFVSFELSPTFLIHITVATASVATSYPTYAVLTSWTSASTFLPLAAVKLKVFLAFGVANSNTQFVSATTTIPCRSQFTLATGTPAPSLPPVVCSSNYSLIPPYQDFTIITSNSVSSSSVLGAMCDVVPTSCGQISVVSANIANSYSGLPGTTLRLANATNSKVTVILSIVDAVRKKAFASIQALSVQVLLLQPPASSGISAAVLFTVTESDPSPFSPPATMQCNPFFDYWALILVIFGPILYIVFRQAYHAGKRKGVKLEKQQIKEEEEMQEGQLHEDGATADLMAASSAMPAGGAGAVGSGTNVGPAPAFPPQQWDPNTVAYFQQFMAAQQQQQQGAFPPTQQQFAAPQQQQQQYPQHDQ